jgi:hypothetical protein
MRDVIYHQLDGIATLPVFALLVVLFVLCNLGFQWRSKVMREIAGHDVKLFDIRESYTPDEARELLKTIDERGRRIYAITQLTLDLVFPFIYGGLFIITLYRLYGNPGYLLLVPLIAVVADLLENLMTTYLALSYEGLASPVARVASTFTTVKRAGLVISVVLILAGTTIWVWRYRKGNV